MLKISVSSDYLPNQCNDNERSVGEAATSSQGKGTTTTERRQAEEQQQTTMSTTNSLAKFQQNSNNGLAVEPETDAAAAQHVNMLGSHRTPPIASQLRKQFKDASTQTDATFHIDYDTLANTTSLAKLGWDNFKTIQNQQDEHFAEKIMDAAAIAIPEYLLNSPTWQGHLGHPPDIRICEDENDPNKIFVSQLESNTMGWGALLAGPRCALNAHQANLQAIGRKLDGVKNPLVMVCCSGRASTKDGGAPRDNTIMGEKLWIADQIAEGMRQTRGSDGVKVTGFEPGEYDEIVAKDPDFNKDNRGNVVVGYSLEFNSGDNISIMDGQLYLKDKPVHFVFNERAVAYFERKCGEKIDPEKTMVGAMADLGTDKFKSYTAHNKYISTPGVEFSPLCSREIRAVLCHTKNEIFQAVSRFFSEGRQSILKPDKTGSGHGIRVVRFADNNPTAIRKKIDESVKEVNQKYNQNGVINAGFPYTVAEYLKGRRIQVPDDLQAKYGHLEGCSGEIRLGIFPRQKDGVKQYTGVPYIARLQQPGSDVANVTTQKEHYAGRPEGQLVLPGCNPDVWRLFGLTEKDMIEISRFYVKSSLCAVMDIAKATEMRSAVKE